LISALFGFTPFTSFADGPRLYLPKEALNACVGRAAGDSCTIQMLGNVVYSKCGLLEDGATLACLPPPPPPSQAEAIAACSGHSGGEACSYAGPNRTISGICAAVPNASELACMPAFRVP
jgi:hypothetical protein